MIVENIDNLIADITKFFDTNYNPSDPIIVPGNVIGGWGENTTTTRRFSDDFLKHLSEPLISLTETKIIGEKEYDVIPDDIKELTADFIINHDSTSGYNGTKIDLETAHEMYKYNISFIIRDREMVMRRNVTLVPKEGEETQWFENVNSYTMARRPKFDHFSQLHDNEYKEFKDLQYKRERQGNDKSIQSDNMVSTMSEHMRSYFLADLYRQTTDNTMKNDGVFQ
jgi:hypothetical protein